MQLPGCQVWAGTKQWPASRSTSCRLSSSSFCQPSCRSCSARALTTSTTDSQATPPILCAVYTGDCCSHREHLFTFDRKGENCSLLFVSPNSHPKSCSCSTRILQRIVLTGKHGHGKKIVRPKFMVCTLYNSAALRFHLQFCSAVSDFSHLNDGDVSEFLLP